MVDSVDVDDTGKVTVTVLLTVAGCPMQGHASPGGDRRRSARSPASPGSSVDLGVMNAEQRAALQEGLRGGQAPREIPFAQPGSLTKVYAIASGKGGVGKSSVTVNLAVALAQQGLQGRHRRRGHLRPLGAGHARRRRHPADPGRGPDHAGADVQRRSVISIGMLKPRRDQVVAWRGPMLDRALVQMLSDVYWGDLDVLLLDLPPGTGDVAISLGQHLPNAEVIVVTTPQEAAAEVAERAGTMASMMHQRVIGVVENMSYLDAARDGSRTASSCSAPAAAPGSRETLSQRFGYDVPVLGEIPLDVDLRDGGDLGRPIVEVGPHRALGRRRSSSSPTSSAPAAAAWPACSSD